MSEREAEAAFQRACVLEQAGDAAGALVEFARATELHDRDPRFWIARGVALLGLRHFDEAVRCLRTGVDLRPHYAEADARMFLAEALLGAGHRAAARAEWRIVSEMEPTYPSHEGSMREAKRRLAED